MHPDVSGAISVNLKDVTVEEALDCDPRPLRLRVQDRRPRVFVQAAGLQTRVFQVNYLPGQRRGASDVRVQSGAVERTPALAGGAPGRTPTHRRRSASRSLESSRVRTEQASDFWVDLRSRAGDASSAPAKAAPWW